MTSPTVYEAKRRILRAALDVLRYEQDLADDTPPLAHLKRAEDAMALAARDLTQAIDALPVVQHPKGWAA